MKITIKKKDIISWKFNEGSFEFEVKEKDQGEELKNTILSQSNQKKLEDINAASGKFGDDRSPLIVEGIDG